MGELHAKLNVDSAMRVRRPGMKWDWQHGLAGLVQATQVPPVWRPPEGLVGLAAAAVGGGRAWPV